MIIVFGREKNGNGEVFVEVSSGSEEDLRKSLDAVGDVDDRSEVITVIKSIDDDDDPANPAYKAIAAIQDLAREAIGASDRTALEKLLLQSFNAGVMYAKTGR